MTTHRRRALMALVIPLAVALGWVTIIGSAFDPAGIHDAGALPDRIHACGRTWNKGASTPTSAESIVALLGEEPKLVAPGLLGRVLASCPSGACTDNASNGPCDTVIYVRVGEDAYVDYALTGGP